MLILKQQLFFFCFSFRGYGKAFVFQDITEEDVSMVQEYVSNELPGHLEILLTQNNVQYSHKEKLCFFGAYAAIPNTFCFAPGEKKMILKLVQNVKDTIEKHGLQHYAEQTTVIKKKLIENNMVQTVFGLVFGVEEKKKEDLVDVKMQQENALFEKAQIMFTQYQKKLQTVQTFSINMVNVENDGDKFKGKVSCIFCERNNQIKIFWKSSCNWVMTNLSAHINKKHLAAVEDELPKMCEKMVIAEETQKSPSMHKDSNQNSISVQQHNNACEDTLYTQISTQCIKMANTVAHNKDRAQQKCLNIPSVQKRDHKTVKLCRIPANGNCLFLAIAHQLYNVKVGSTDHHEKGDDLRKNVVNYILDEANFPKFLHDIKNRLQIQPIPTQITEACKDFVDGQLSVNGVWGGMETIKAISEDQNVNIIIMNENGECNLPNRYNINATKCLLLLFGQTNSKSCKSNDERSHYDSVVHIPENKIALIAQELSEAQSKYENFLEDVNSSNVIELE